MITNIFQLCYTTSMHPVRLTPLSKEELTDGMSADDVNNYLSFVEQLYQVLFHDVDTEFIPLTDAEHHEKWFARTQVYTALIEFLLKKNAISVDAFCELKRLMPIEYNFTAHPVIPGKFVGDSIDDFRLAFEYTLLENDENIDLYNEYLDARYGYCISFLSGTSSCNHAKQPNLLVFRIEGTLPSRHAIQATYWEVWQLLRTIRKDIESNADEQKRLDEIFIKSQKPNISYLDSLQKTIYGRPQNIAEWYTIKRALEKESNFLWYIEDKIRSIFENMEKPTNGVGFGDTLFIYKGKVLCHKHSHPIIPATALVHDEHDREVELDVEYCPTCQRYMLNFISYENYRRQYTLLIGKMRMISCSGDGGEFDMASESPLKLCGYNVSQSGGLSSATRQFLLSKIIYDGILSKLDVIHYLEHFISMNGAKQENALALEKWREDLDFVHKYNKSIQPKVFIKKIQKY